MESWNMVPAITHEVSGDQVLFYITQDSLEFPLRLFPVVQQFKIVNMRNILIKQSMYNVRKCPHMKALLKAYDMQCMQLRMQLCASISASTYQRKLQLYVGLYLFLNVNSSIIKLDTLSKILNHGRWAYNYNQIEFKCLFLTLII